MRRAAAASVIALALLAAPAHATVEGALTELTGAGSCLTQSPAATADCSPLAGVPDAPTAGGDIRPPALRAPGRRADLRTPRPGPAPHDGPGGRYPPAPGPARRPAG